MASPSRISSTGEANLQLHNSDSNPKIEANREGEQIRHSRKNKDEDVIEWKDEGTDDEEDGVELGLVGRL